MTIESRNNPANHNLNHKTGDDSWGCFQINRYGKLADSRPSPEWLVNPVNNATHALSMYKSQGWQPWANTMNKLRKK